MQDPRHRIRIFIGLCLACAFSLAAYFYWVKARTGSRTGAETPGTTTANAAGLRVDKSSGDQPREILFRYTGVDENYAHYRQLAVVDPANLEKPRFIDGVFCESVHFASGRGLLLTTTWGSYPAYFARIFDANFKELFVFPLKGSPSRTRVSPDGSFGAFTVFLTGHGYASLDFTTETLLVDMVRGQTMASLEDFKVTRDGQPFRAPDFNFWGVTFAPDSRRFYATLSTNRKHYLVEADIAARTATVVHENVECPSVSPDGSRIAYKKRLFVQGRLFWQLHVLDLATKKETPLSEKRSVDDQLEWFDNAHVLYTVSDNPDGSSATTNVWKTDTEGKTPPKLFLPRAYSPAAIR